MKTLMKYLTILIVIALVSSKMRFLENSTSNSTTSPENNTVPSNSTTSPENSTVPSNSTTSPENSTVKNESSTNEIETYLEYPDLDVISLIKDISIKIPIFEREMHDILKYVNTTTFKFYQGKYEVPEDALVVNVFDEEFFEKVLRSIIIQFESKSAEFFGKIENSLKIPNNFEIHNSDNSTKLNLTNKQLGQKFERLINAMNVLMYDFQKLLIIRVDPTQSIINQDEGLINNEYLVPFIEAQKLITNMKEIFKVFRVFVGSSYIHDWVISISDLNNTLQMFGINAKIQMTKKINLTGLHSDANKTFNSSIQSQTSFALPTDNEGN